jgi:hypothetical protein
MKVAFVSYADGHYIPVQATLIKSIHKHHPDAAVFSFHDLKTIGSPSHQERPYAFKVYAVEYARKLGYDVVIWLDSPFRLIKPIDEWVKEIEKVGVYLQRDGWWCGQWANDNSLDYFGVTRDEAMTIPNVYACIMAFDFRHPITPVFFALWKTACENGAFCGKGNNTEKTESQDERCLGHRHDQTCAELIAHQIKLPLSELVLGEDRLFLSWIEV